MGGALSTTLCDSLSVTSGKLVVFMGTLIKLTFMI